MEAAIMTSFWGCITSPVNHWNPWQVCWNRTKNRREITRCWFQLEAKHNRLGRKGRWQQCTWHW